MMATILIMAHMKKEKKNVALFQEKCKKFKNYFRSLCKKLNVMDLRLFKFTQGLLRGDQLDKTCDVCHF